MCAAYPADEAATREKLHFRIVNANDCFTVAHDADGRLVAFVCGTRAPAGRLSTSVAVCARACVSVRVCACMCVNVRGVRACVCVRLCARRCHRDGHYLLIIIITIVLFSLSPSPVFSHPAHCVCDSSRLHESS